MTEQSISRPGLEPMGWDAEFERSFALVAGPGTEPARVIARQRDRWTVWTEDGSRTAVAAGRLEAIDEWPGVGDWVVVEGVAGSSYVLVRIVDLVPRRSAFRRLAAGSRQTEQVLAANVDLALVLTALPSDLNLRRLERYVTLAWDSGALPVIVLTKLDLTTDSAAAVHAAGEAAPGVDVVAISSLTGTGLDALRDRLPPRRTAVLVGSSGVGKSTLLNRLLGEERARTNAVRDDGRGRHTTSHRELFRTSWGALIIDTPGLREVGLWADGTALDASFPDIAALATECRFRDCGHTVEPDCAVRAAVDRGTLDAGRLESWHRLGRELAHLERKEDPRAASEEVARRRTVHRSFRREMRRKYSDED